MSKEKLTVNEKFLGEISKHMKNHNEINIKEIYSLFPKINKNNFLEVVFISTARKLYKTGHGIYSVNRKRNNLAAGYDYLQRKSQKSMTY